MPLNGIDKRTSHHERPSDLFSESAQLATLARQRPMLTASSSARTFEIVLRFFVMAGTSGPS